MVRRRSRLLVIFVVFVMLAAGSGCSDSPTAPTPPPNTPQPVEPVVPVYTSIQVVSALDNSPVQNGEVVHKNGTVAISGGRAELKNVSVNDEITIRVDGYLERNTLYCGAQTLNLWPNAGQGGVDVNVIKYMAGWIYAPGRNTYIVLSDVLKNDPEARSVHEQAAARVTLVTKGRQTVSIVEAGTSNPNGPVFTAVIDPSVLSSEFGAAVVGSNIVYRDMSIARYLRTVTHEFVHTLPVLHYPYPGGLMTGKILDGFNTDMTGSEDFLEAEVNLINLRYTRKEGTNVIDGLREYDRHLGCS